MDTREPHPGQLRLVLVDDHPVVRVGLRIVLEQDPRLRVVAEAASGHEALHVVHAEAPDVAIVDLNLPDVGGLQVTRAIKQFQPGTRVLIVSAFAEIEHVVGLLDAGERVVSQTLLGALVAKASARAAQSETVALSEREREVLHWLAEGATSKEIAATLGLRPKTVECHRARILDKFGVVNSAAAVRAALAQGLVGPSQVAGTAFSA